jgi:hypothetical protein
MEGKACWSNMRYYLTTCLAELRNTTENLSRDSKSSGQDLNLGSPEYKAPFAFPTFKASSNTADEKLLWRFLAPVFLILIL